MDTAQQSKTRCPVFLHPASATNPSSISNIQRATGQLFVLTGGRPQLTQRCTSPTPDDFGPFGGDAA